MLRELALASLVAGIVAYPGPAHLHPTIHFAPDYVAQDNGWHDIAGALTHKGVHHIYQGTGWNHAFSTDLVHWQTGPHGPKPIHETYKGMDSFTDPCSGFLTKDLDGTVCAGFRQCGSNKGVEGLNSWDVPLELRCALDDDMNTWSENPDYLFNVSWYRSIPYDPARPWREADGNWYVLLSMDGCNTTTRAVPCKVGGELHMWRSPALRGAKANWEHVGPVFTTNATVLKTGYLSKEFVTIDFVGMLPGDPSPEKDTRVFFNNVGGNGGGDGCCDGTTSFFTVTHAPGQPFVEVLPQGMVDWGAFKLLQAPPAGAHGLDLLDGTASRGFSMARTLGTEEADQVSKPGRRVMIGWTGPGLAAVSGQGSAQSLPRDLSLGPDRSLRQAFVAELQMLRDTHFSVSPGTWVNGTLQAEILAKFSYSLETVSIEDFGVSVLGERGGNHTATHIALSPSRGLVTVDATAQGNLDIRAGPLPPATADGFWIVHAVVDHGILEVIVNNITALVVYVVPPTPEAVRVQLFGPGAYWSSLDVWTLSSAHPEQAFARQADELIV